MKTLIRIITALLIVFMIAAGTDLTLKSLVIIVPCLAWLGLVGFATWRGEKR